MEASTLKSRDFDDYDSHDGLLFGFFVLFLFACLMSVMLLYFRRRRMLQQRAALLPSYQRRGHQRSVTVTSTPTYAGLEKVLVYDEKMNLIANANGRPDSPIPEIRITFPDEVDQQSGQKMSGRVVVVRITDSGSVGMEPLPTEQLPPYQQADSGKFESLELDRLGGLKEGQAPARSQQARWGC